VCPIPYGRSQEKDVGILEKVEKKKDDKVRGGPVGRQRVKNRRREFKERATQRASNQRQI